MKVEKVPVEPVYEFVVTLTRQEAEVIAAVCYRCVVGPDKGGRGVTENLADRLIRAGVDPHAQEIDLSESRVGVAWLC